MVNGQNDHFDRDHSTILSSNGNGQMVKINRNFNNFNNETRIAPAILDHMGGR
jgi:hypothetical protein